MGLGDRQHRGISLASLRPVGIDGNYVPSGSENPVVTVQPAGTTHANSPSAAPSVQPEARSSHRVAPGAASHASEQSVPCTQVLGLPHGRPPQTIGGPQMRGERAAHHSQNLTFGF